MNDLTNLFEKSRVTRTFAFDREGDEVAGVDESGNVLFHVRHFPLGNFWGSTSNLSRSSIVKLPQIETLEPYLKRLLMLGWLFTTRTLRSRTLRICSVSHLKSSA